MHIVKYPPNKQNQRKEKIPKSLSQKFIAQIINKTFQKEDFLKLCQGDEILSHLQLSEDSLSFLETIGIALHQENQILSLKTQNTLWLDQDFCFLDIESTNANPLKGNLLEIGAILCNGKGEVKRRFESFVQNDEIPSIIQEITHITPEETKNAPEVQNVLKEFRQFLGTSIIVAHNVSFDYHFLDFLYFKYFGIGLYNQTLCTLKIAQKTIQAPKYKLSFLNEFLEIFTPISHRAYADAHTCKEIFFKCKPYFPIGTTQNLLNWASKKV